MSDAADKQDFKAALARLLEAFDERQGVHAVDQYAGVGDPDPLEHTTRVLLLDGIIQSLGWELVGGREVAEEARLQVETTLFIDYLGVDPDQRTPLLIIEAKAWSKPFVRPRDGRVKGGPSELILRAINHIRTGGDAGLSPVTEDWHNSLKQVREYVKGLLDEHGHRVERVVLTTGQWMVIFRTPVSTFCSNEPLLDDQWMIIQKDCFVEQSDGIFELISRNRLIKSAPRHIRTTQLLAYLHLGDLRSVFHSLLVKHEESGHSYMRVVPQIHVYPSISLLRTDGQLITVHGGHDPFTVPLTVGEIVLHDHLREVDAAAQVLLQEVLTEMGVQLPPSPLTEFSGFMPRPRHSAVSALGIDGLGEPETIYLDMNPSVPCEGVVATGTATHFLLSQPTVQCQYHDWLNCRAVGMEANANAITVRSTNPRSFFISGEQHHCAHRGMHDRRDSRCKIDPIDRYLCCMSCAFQSVCWPAGHAQPLPCGL
jgi:hypothetical protein